MKRLLIFGLLLLGISTALAQDDVPKTAAEDWPWWRGPNNSGGVTNADSTKVRSVDTGRATAPFVVDQHLVFASGGKVEILGDPRDYNNGFGQVGVRILSWRPRQ